MPRSLPRAEQPVGRKLKDRPALPGADLRLLPIDAIDLPRRPVRRLLGDIGALAASLHDYGLQHPVSVRQEGDRYILTSGLRRFEAAKLLHWRVIAAFVRDVDADRAYVVDLVENLQRESLTEQEEASALMELVRRRGWTLERVAHAIKRSVGYVSKRVRVFEDPILQEAVTREGLPVSTAEELLAADTELRPTLAAAALAAGWDQTTVRQAIRAAATPAAAPETAEEAWDALGEVVAGAAEATGQTVAPETRETSDQAPGFRYENPSRRPSGLTARIREFHRLLVAVPPEALTEQDRAALRALFRDLVMLAQAPAERRPRVVPPLPVAG